ncbi:hypothetical protein K450DRAFT_252142 [Umbelopsis ramanniana AG]|uniref:RING-type domain-containing protein n=1 Tax=Umbelopsis ramanniana AG TaxID=1314678 RepID=A0AAD5HAR7_UMBRA|nr:uncharacterized protein K450DRAFT_252142 [Umbelopsis ramanniana AG]KAI8577365.1 hypothetical protein K450DRAFT_252142 [Umbelopsis ramanniana AG]
MFGMMKQYGKCLLLLLLIPMVQAQSVSNPFFLHTLWQYTGSDISVGTANLSTSEVASSQLFQTIDPYDDQSVSQINDRVLLKFGTACNATTNFTTVQTLNSNVIGTVSNVSIIALIERSADCYWAEKIATAQSISSTNHLLLKAILIYDNITYMNTNPVVSAAEGTTSTPSYPASLPNDQNITFMKDNNIDLTSYNGLPTYFISNAYGSNLSSLADSANAQSSGNNKMVWLVRPVLATVCWSNCPDGFTSMISSAKGYLSYVIALAALFLVAAVLLRWYRMRRYNAQLSRGDIERGIPMHNRPVNKVHPLPVDILNTYPIEKYSPSLVKNGSCAICLDDFVVDKNEIRVLPCGHGFCTGCIDPWLTDKSPLCPICKHDCLPPDLRKNADLVEQNNAVQLGAASPFNTPSAAAAAALASTSTPAASVHSPNVQDHTEEPATETINHEQHTDLEGTSVDHQNVDVAHLTPPPHTPQDTDGTDTERHGTQ